MHQRLNKLLVQKKGEALEFSAENEASEKTSSPSERLQYLKEVREMIDVRKGEIMDRHRGGAGGITTIHAYTKLVDDLILNIYQVVTDDHKNSVKAEAGNNITEGLNHPFALVALGGYGRGELNPFSDIDILFLFEKRLNQYTDFAIHNMISILWDIGFHVGHSARSVNDCLSIAKNDITARTAMMEARYLAGDREVFNRFFASFKRYVMNKGVDDFIKIKLEENVQRHFLYYNTVCISEPNVKEGQGGLRDIHTALWASMARFGISSLEGIERRGIIDNREREGIVKSLDFIFRVRNEMHFLAGKKEDVLSYEIQEEVSKNLGYRNDKGARGVIWFMKDYYDNASSINTFSNSLIERCLKYRAGILKMITFLKTRDIGDGFVSIKNEIYVKDLNPHIFKNNPLLLLKVFLYCQELNLTLSNSIKRTINLSLSLIDEKFIHSSESNEIFRRIIRGKGLSKVLRMMHGCGILRRFIGEFEYITYFSNYDLYHKFTVDEHILRSLECLEGLSETGDEEAEIRKIYKGIYDTMVLKISLLLHDIGKSDSPGHIQRGLEIASPLLKRWGLKDIRDTVLLLVGNHLLMNHIAQRRDMHDEKTIAGFCKQIESIENLKMLYLLTYADLKAVGTDIWTNWKSALLWELYLRAYEYFSMGEEERIFDRSLIDKKKGDVLALIEGESEREDAYTYFSSMPERYVLSTSPEKIVRHIKLAGELNGKKLVIKISHNLDIGYTELMVCTVGKAGVFSKIAGTLTSKNINILGAQIYTRLDNIAIDTLQISTIDGEPVLDEGVLQRFEKDLLHVLEGKKMVEELLSSRQKISIPLEKKGFKISTKVEIDNTLSDAHTIIEVITGDRLGVLYDITHTLFNYGVNIYIAKISTEGKTAIDVFYVTEIDGKKILDGDKLDMIKGSLLRVLG
ncbi:MAG: [protein-PII] uridylyltransferase [Nitrospinota bacterium]